jgi:glycosyltransferase involved in cell wall biosynthesis
MAAKFLIVNNGMTEARGHYVEVGIAMARAARARGFDVLMAVHARCDVTALPSDLPTLPFFRVDHWGHFVEERMPAAMPLRGELRPLCDTPIEVVLDGRASFRELLDARFAQSPAAAEGWKAKLTRIARRVFPPLIIGAFRALVPPIGFDWLRAISRRARGLPPAPWSEADGTQWSDSAPLPQDVEGLLRRELGRIPPDHNEFTHYRMFAEDFERLLTLCEIGPNDHVYLPTAYGRDAAAILALVNRVGTDRVPTFHLEYLHPILSAAELERETCPFKAFHTRTHRAYFDACRAYPESPRVQFYADTPEHVADYSALAGFGFRHLPVPFRADLIPPSPLRRENDPLRVLFLGDLREEKGFTKLPALMRAVSAELHGPRIQFVVPGAIHTEERTPEMMTALAELESYPPDMVERPHRDGFIPADDYYRLLASADVVLCPYDAKVYRNRTSGVFAEAVAAGKPTIVPADTWLSSAQEPGTGEAYVNDRDLFRALRRVCGDYARYRAAAKAASERWLARHSPENVLAEMLGEAAPRAASGQVKPALASVS